MQHQGNRSYNKRLRQSQLTCGADGTLKPGVTCNYCIDKSQMKDNCACLNKMIVPDLQRQENAMTVKNQQWQYEQT